MNYNKCCNNFFLSTRIYIVIRVFAANLSNECTHIINPQLGSIEHKMQGKRITPVMSQRLEYEPASGI